MSQPPTTISAGRTPLAGLRAEGEAAVRLVLAALAAGIAVASAVIWRSLV